MSRDTFFLVIASVLVALGAVLAFAVIGSPSHARTIALDQQRAEDLHNIETLVKTRYSTGTGGLPAELPPDLTSQRDRKRLLFDPGTGRPYVYRRIDGSHFRLCATFDFPSTDVDRDPESDAPPHGAGTVCRDDRISTRP